MTETARFDAVVEQLIETGGPGAAVAVLREGRFVHRKAYGLADLEWGTALAPDCSFRIASLTKQFTAAAILRLEAQGRVSIDDPLEAHLPDFDPRGRRVSLRSLLNHTSGLRNHDLGQGSRAGRPNTPRAEVLASVKAAPFDSEPGERYRYCNSGYLLLGAVIEAVSGVSYATFVAAEFFEPLGMARTGMFAPRRITPKRARGYVRGRGGFHNADPDPFNWSDSAGALSSTLDDLALWDGALRDGRVMTPDAFARMIEPTRLTNGTVYPYGLGWGTATYGGHALHHHTGGISGFACQMARLNDGSLTTIVLSNLYLFPFDRVTRGLLRAALDMPERRGPFTPPEPSDLHACAGVFENDEGGQVVIDASGGRRARLAAVGEGHLCDPQDPEVELRFSKMTGDSYQILEYVSPLWPTQTYARAANAGGERL
ncbi:MAG TPA: serine hydrolase domain-containing protein [Caulobacteraceae bacterium]|jgi:CubicO group peptidase (beta-lactamase class C family)|nr:serine hydrolase domain-containing protein [Caulobacteraceae bacterium]